MGFSGWKSRVALVIQSAQVPADMTDFPVLLTKDNIPVESYEADSGFAALNGGGDLRFSSDAAGNTRLACEVSRFVTDNTPANADVEIWVKIPSISSASNTTFYMWYGKAGESQPARNDTYGMQNVWNSAYKAVAHLSEGWNTTANGFNESTATQAHGTGALTTGAPTVTTVSGKWGGRAVRCTDSADYSKVWQIGFPGTNLDIDPPFTWEAWIKKVEPTLFFLSKGDTSSVQDWNMRGIGSLDADDKLWWCRTAGDSSIKSSGTISNDTWTHVAAIIAADGSLVFYINGSSSGSAGAGTIGTTSGGTNTMRLGNASGNAYGETWKGNVDELRIHNTNRSANYLLMEYRTMNAPESVIVEGAPLRMSKKNFMPFFQIQ